MKKQVLYISYDGMTDPLGQSQVLPYLVGLTQKGYKFTLLSFEKRERFLKSKDVIEKICTENNIDWRPLSYTKTPPVLSTVWDIIRLRKLVFKLHKKINFAIIHCRSYLSALIGLEMKNKFGTKFIFDMRGFWADERVDGKIWDLNNPIYKTIYNYFKKKEKQFFENADYSISLTHNAKNEIHQWELRNNPVPIQVIPCCVDRRLFDPSKINLEDQVKLKKELDISESDFVLSYLGSIGTWYMLDDMLNFFKVLLSKTPNSIFFFITADEPEFIYGRCKFLNIPQEHIRIKQAKRNQVPLFLSLSSLNIFFILPVFSKRASSPTKQGEVMSMGIPAICNNLVGDTEKIILDYDAGYVVIEFNDKHYNKVIEQFLNSPKKASDIIEGAEYFSLNRGIESYAKVYETVLN